MIKDISNQQFGNFKVLYNIPRPIKTKNRTSWWLVECKCGKQLPMRADYLKAKKRRTCGCDNTRKEIRGNKSWHWKGYGDMPSTYWAGLIHGAKKRNIEFNITKKYAWDIFIKQNKKCIYTGRPLGFSEYVDNKDASLDRIDSSKGYIKGNIQWVHRDINIMKWSKSHDEFLQICKEIIDYSK